MTLLNFKLYIPIFKPSILNCITLVNDAEPLWLALDKLSLVLDTLLCNVLDPIPVLLVIDPLSLLRFVVWVDKLSPAVYLAFPELAFVLLTLTAVELLQPHPVHVVVTPRALVPTPVRPLVQPLPVLLSVFEHA